MAEPRDIQKLLAECYDDLENEMFAEKQSAEYDQLENEMSEKEQSAKEDWGDGFDDRESGDWEDDVYIESVDAEEDEPERQTPDVETDLDIEYDYKSDDDWEGSVDLRVYKQANERQSEIVSWLISSPYAIRDTKSKDFEVNNDEYAKLENGDVVHLRSWLFLEGIRNNLYVNNYLIEVTDRLLFTLYGLKFRFCDTELLTAPFNLQEDVNTSLEELREEHT